LSDRDTGSARTEARLLVHHLAHWQHVLDRLVRAASPCLHVTIFEDGALRERFADTVLSALPREGAVRLVEDPERRRGRGYYCGAALRITAGKARRSS